MLLESFCLFFSLATAIMGKGFLWFNKNLGTKGPTPANPEVEEKKCRRCEKIPFFSASAFSSCEDQPSWLQSSSGIN